MTKIPAHGFRGFNPFWLSCQGRAAHIMMNKKQSQTREGAKATDVLQGHVLSDLLSSSRPPSTVLPPPKAIRVLNPSME
jgi:hypothetical protein